MKKILIITTILISFFLLNENVSAYCDNSSSLSSSNAIALNTYKMSKEEIMTYVNKGYYLGQGQTQTEFVVNSILKLRNYYETNLKGEYQYYFISYYSYSNSYDLAEFRLNVFNDSDLNRDNKDYVLNSHNHYRENRLSVLSFTINSVVNNTVYAYSTGSNYLTLSFSNKYENVNYKITVNPVNNGSNYSIYYETNYKSDLYLNENNISDVFSSLTYEDVNYLPGEKIFNTFDGLGVKISLNLKAMFNSGTNASAMKKINLEFSNDDTKIKDNKAYFKIQIGSNDFKISNIPILSSYKIYGRNSDANNWQEIKLDYNYCDDDDNCIYSITDYNIEKYEVEDTLTEHIYTFTFNMPSDICIYTYFKIEFVFNNTNNFYAYMYDSLDTSSYVDIGSYFENYTYYKFSKDYRYAFISYNENVTNEKVFFPFLDYNKLNLKAYCFNYVTNEIGAILKPNLFKENDDFYYYDIVINHDITQTIVLTKDSGIEDTYFYLPNGYNVSFSTRDNDKFDIMTPSGLINNKIDDIIDDNIYNDEIEHSALYNILVQPFIDYIDRNLPIFNQIGVIIKSLQFKEHDTVPPISIDLSYLGMSSNAILIDLNAYKSVRDIVFLFEKIGILVIALPKFIKYIKEFFGGGH